MINIERPSTVPASLQTQPIQDYLNNLVAWRKDQALPSDEQTLPKPETTPSYRGSDLIEAFDECFFAKCYLTEKKFDNSYEMDVEHFFAKNFDEHPELRYEWTNLYPADHDSNMIKPRTTPVGGYLDPCNPDEDVETEIRYDSSLGGEKCFFEARNPLNLKAVNTAKLLDRVHNGHDKVSKTKTKGLRFAIFKHKYSLLKYISEWRRAVMENDDDNAFVHSNQIKLLLSRESAFTMLLRSTSAAKHLPREFFD
jgi:hypothetical protein